MVKTEIRYETLRIGETLIFDGEEWLLTNIRQIGSRSILTLKRVTENNHEKAQ